MTTPSVFRLASLACALTLAVAPFCAQALQAPGGDAGRPARHGARLDANGDGAIDRSEAAKAPKLLERFDRLDANRNGRIEADERPHRGGRDGRRGAERGGQRLARLDANHDGAIDRAEAAKAPKLLERFDRLDANHDGRIGADERPHGRGRGARLDTDGDRRISRLEAGGHARLAARFDAIDGNRDGFIDRDEVRRYREQHRGEGRGAQPSP